jgi:hypothetical protein
MRTQNKGIAQLYSLVCRVDTKFLKANKSTNMEESNTRTRKRDRAEETGDEGEGQHQSAAGPPAHFNLNELQTMNNYSAPPRQGARSRLHSKKTTLP